MRDSYREGYGVQCARVDLTRYNTMSYIIISLQYTGKYFWQETPTLESVPTYLCIHID